MVNVYSKKTVRSEERVYIANDDPVVQMNGLKDTRPEDEKRERKREEKTIPSVFSSFLHARKLVRVKAVAKYRYWRIGVKEGAMCGVRYLS